MNWWWVCEEDDGRKGGWTRERVCGRGVYFHVGVVKIFRFLKFFVLLSVAKHGDPAKVFRISEKEKRIFFKVF